MSTPQFRNGASGARPWVVTGIVALLVVVALAFAACSDDEDDGTVATGTPAGPAATAGLTPTAEPTPDLTGPVIMSRRGPCLEECPEYLVIIRANGSVEYQGTAAVAVTGTEFSSIAVDDAQRVFDRIQEMGFTFLEHEYPCLTEEALHTTVTTFVRGTGQEFAVSRCAVSDAPQELEDLEDLIDEVSGSARWVEGTE